MEKQSFRSESASKRWGYRVIVLLVVIGATFLIERSFLPLPQNKKINAWKKDIKEYEQVFTRQTDLAESVELTSQEIGSFDISVHQVQKETEIEGYIKLVENTGIKSAKELKSNYNIQASNILLLHYEARKLLGAMQRNYNQVVKQLEDCRANIPEGSLSRAPYK